MCRSRLSQRLSSGLSMKLREAPIPEVEEATHDASDSPAHQRDHKDDPSSDHKEHGSGASDKGSQSDSEEEGVIEGDLGDLDRGLKEVHHCPVCSITTTSAAHLEVSHPHHAVLLSWLVQLSCLWSFCAHLSFIVLIRAEQPDMAGQMICFMGMCAPLCQTIAYMTGRWHEGVCMPVQTTTHARCSD